MLDGFSLNLGRVDDQTQTADSDDVEEREVEDGFVTDMFERVSDDFIKEFADDFRSFSLSVRELIRACVDESEIDEDEICNLISSEIPSELHHNQVSPDKSLILVPTENGFLLCHIRNAEGSIEYESQIISGRRIDNDNLISFFYILLPEDELEDQVSDDSQVTVSYYSDSRSLQRLFNGVDLSETRNRNREVTIEGEYTGSLDMEAAFTFEEDSFEECYESGAVEFDKEEDQFTINMDSGREIYDFIAGRYSDTRRESIRLFLKDRWSVQEDLQLPRLQHTHITSYMESFRETPDAVLNTDGDRQFTKGGGSTKHIIYSGGTDGTATEELLEDLITQVKTDADTSIYFPAKRHYSEHLVIHGQESKIRMFNVKAEYLSEDSKTLIETLYERTEMNTLSDLYRSLFSLLTLRSVAICLRTESGNTPAVADTITDLLDTIQFEMDSGEIAEAENDIVEFKLGRRIKEDNKEEVVEEIRKISGSQAGPDEFEDLLGYVKLVVWGVDDAGEIIGFENIESHLESNGSGSVNIGSQQVNSDYVQELRDYIDDRIRGRAISKKLTVDDKTILITGVIISEYSTDETSQALASVFS